MRIKILGAKGEIKISKTGYQKHSGVLIDSTILLDLGEKEYLNYNPKIIFITHLHPDHAFFISEKEKVNISIPVYAPEKTLKLETIQILTGPLFIDSYKITPIPVTHSLKVESQGYLIEKGAKRVFYTGDIVSINKTFHKQLHNLDAVITEASFIRKGGVIRKNRIGQKYGHAGIAEIIEVFKTFTNRIIFTHFGTWFLKNIQAGELKIKNLQTKNLMLQIAYDGKEYSI